MAALAAAAAAAVPAACARAPRPAAPPAPAPGAPAAVPAGAWLATVTQPGGFQVVTRLTVEPAPGGGWAAYSRRGGAAALVRWPKRTVGRLLGKLPPRGALVAVDGGTARRPGGAAGDTVRVRARFRSPLLGARDLVGDLAGGRLTADLLWPGTDLVSATVVMAPDTAPGRPVRDYRALARAVRDSTSARVYDPRLTSGPAWQRFFRDLDRAFARADDDVDAMAAFYALKPRVGISHVEFVRNPTLAAQSLAELVGKPGDLDRLVTLTFPAPGVALLNVRRWDVVEPAVARAFARVDSARPHTLIVDIRGNPGGDASSMSVAAFLVRDSTPAGVFLGRPWYAAHAGPPARADWPRLPTYDRARGTMGFLDDVRRTGVVTGVVPPMTPRFDGPVYLLTDGRTGSASEPLAHLLRATGRATLVGARTAGAMLSGPPGTLGEGWILVVPEADYWAADGVRIEGRGVAPHVEARPDTALAAVAALVRARDPYAAAALAGQAYLDASRWDDAERAYVKAARLAPGRAGPMVGLGRAAQGRQAWDSAFARFGRAVALGTAGGGAGDAGAVRAARYQIGRTAALSGARLDDGAAQLAAYLAAPGAPGDPALAGAHWWLGQIREKQGRREEARAHYETAARLDPDAGYARASLRALARGGAVAAR